MELIQALLWILRLVQIVDLFLKVKMGAVANN